MSDPVREWADATVERQRREATDAAMLRAFTSLERLLDVLIERLDRELAEIRDGLVELDHAKVPRAAFEELHTRVDRLEARP